jgi:hypothetical protein
LFGIAQHTKGWRDAPAFFVGLKKWRNFAAGIRADRVDYGSGEKRVASGELLEFS